MVTITPTPPTPPHLTLPQLSSNKKAESPEIVTESCIVRCRNLANAWMLSACRTNDHLQL